MRLALSIYPNTLQTLKLQLETMISFETLGILQVLFKVNPKETILILSVAVYD